MRHDADRPVARTQDLVVQAVGDQLLVYDLARHLAHSLNGVAAAVWRRCDGTRTVAELTTALGAAGPPLPAAAVRYALAELGRARLLTAPVGPAGVTRRDLLRRLGPAAAVPLVLSLAAPTPATAQSPPESSNEPPVVTSLSLTPDPPSTADTLTANATATDPDSDPVTLTFAWLINGTTVPGETTNTLDLSLFSIASGDQIMVEATPNDGFDDGVTASAAVTVA
jgi:hypothetical protein